MNAFNWNTGAPSIFWSAKGEANAKRLEKAKPGHVIDINGRANVDLGPRKGQISISIAGPKKPPMIKKASI